MKNNLIRIPLTLLLVWLAWLGVKQGVSTFFDDRDWSDDYLRSTATIVDSERRIIAGTDSSSTSHYCYLFLEYVFREKTFQERAIWLSMPAKRSYPEKDCGKARYGEEVPVWIGTSGNDPMLLQPGNRNSKPMTMAINLGQGALFLYLASRLWRKKKRAA
ncbi:MAG: hypothetical protein RIC38_03995 [Chromatocurvus sp.]